MNRDSLSSSTSVELQHARHPRSARWSEGAAVHVACDPARPVEKRKVTAKRRACATPDLRSSPRMRADRRTRKHCQVPWGGGPDWQNPYWNIDNHTQAERG